MKSILEIWKNYALYKWYLAILLLAFIKQILSYSQLVDGEEFLTAAHNLLSSGFPDSCSDTRCEHWLHETRRTVGYPLLIVLFGFIKPLLILFQTFVSALIPVYAQKLIFLLKGNSSALKYFLWFLLLYPLQFFYSSLLMPEILCQFLFLLTVIYIVQRHYLVLGLSVAALILLKPVFILIFPFLFLFLFKKGKHKWGLLIPVFFVVVVSTWNNNRTGLFHYSSMGTENIYEYNQRAVLNIVMTNAERELFYLKRDSMLRILNFSEKYELMNTEAKRNIKAHWKLYFWLHLKGSLFALVDPGRYDLIAFFKIPDSGGFMGIKETSIWNKIKVLNPWIIIYLLLFTVINLVKWGFVILGFLKSKKGNLILGAIIFIILAATGPVGSARYLFPLMPVLLVFAAVGLQSFLKNNEKNIAH